MSNRHELISNALDMRFRELCAAVGEIVPAEFGVMSGFVSEVQKQLVSAARVANHAQPPTNWLESDSDCLTSIRQLALSEPIQVREGQQPETESFVRTLRSTSMQNESEQRFQLLTQRYRCPLNFAGPAETDIREHVLQRLMVQDRGRIEKNSLAVVGSDDLLLRLNLIAVNAFLNSDLRFLDALNYYYELIPSNWRPNGRHDWLLVAYFANYVQALTARFVRR